LRVFPAGNSGAATETRDWTGRSFDVRLAVSCADEDLGVAGCGWSAQHDAVAETLVGQQGSQWPDIVAMEWPGVAEHVANGTATNRIASRHSRATIRCFIVLVSAAMI
jgi:hypothetical protein